jgi:hypothetical protein
MFAFSDGKGAQALYDIVSWIPLLPFMHVVGFYLMSDISLQATKYSCCDIAHHSSSFNILPGSPYSFQQVCSLHIRKTIY